MRTRLLFITILAFTSLPVMSQHKMTQGEYAEKYAPLAIKKMQQYGIPASITLAQGILESNCGSSRLAVEGNNHFGIKCKAEWTGARIYHDDDELQECFRKYSSAEESYNDHSIFLTTRSRYADLFKLDKSDYKAWARGLKAAGYATSPDYAERLIKIVEDNQLYKYDKIASNKKVATAPQKKPKPEPEKAVPVVAATTVPAAVENDAVKTGQINGARYIIARSGDSFTTVSLKTGIPVKKLLKYNDLGYETVLKDGDIVYTTKKASSSSDASIYIVDKKTTLYDISQLYGISYKSLQKMNQSDYAENILPIGAEIHLR